jgi:protein-L-isoaspartate O-methyltransferase
MQRLIAELRNSGIADESVLAAIASVDRERFVSPSGPGRTPRFPSPSARRSASRWWSPP